MDSFKVIFIFVIINILESFAQLSLQDKLNLLLRLRRAHDNSKFPTIFNKIISNDVRDMMKEDSERQNRRSFVSEEVPDSSIYDLRKNYDLDPKKFYKVDLRRMYDFHPGMRSPIIASPTMPNQLPEAEPILPGHTLLRPALGMLKSAVKFPHKDMDDGAGVYGNLNNLGMTYGGTGERILYTGFRRNNNNFNDGNDNPTILVALLRQGPEREGVNGPFMKPSTRHYEKPALRYIDYGKREREKKKRQEEEKQRQEQERLGLLQKDSYYNSLGTDDYKVREVKRLLKTLTANGVTLQFFDIPRLKLEAMEKENYPNSIKPYTEFIEATRSKDFTMVKKRFPNIAKQYARDVVVPRQHSYDEYKASGIKSYD